MFNLNNSLIILVRTQTNDIKENTHTLRSKTNSLPMTAKTLHTHSIYIFHYHYKKPRINQFKHKKIILLNNLSTKKVQIHTSRYTHSLD